MSGNVAVPYVLEWKENGLHLTEVDDSKTNINKVAQISYLPNVVEDGQQVFIQSVVPIKIEESGPQEPQLNYVFQVVPNQQNIEVIQPSVQPLIKFKRGRPKKTKDQATTAVKRKETPQKDEPKVPKLAPRTRSGRVVKFPKHIVQDFEKVETNDNKNSSEIKTTEFPKFVEPPAKSKPNEIQGLEFHQQRRKIAAQFRCPKCQKAYLGKTKMMQHIQKHPDHGPVPQSEKKELNFDVWNFLVDITQKCPQAQRGAKFCEELTNLMHNLLLLTSALFKKVEVNKNFVEVDKVLGNAIGLKPGPYSFNDNELYKDVTVLQLLTTTDFFKPSDDAGDPQKDNGRQVDIAVQSGEQNLQEDSASICTDKKLEETPQKPPVFSIPKMEAQSTSELIVPDDVVKKTETSRMHSEMLTDNSILHLSNIRTSVDDLMMTTVDTGGTLLDNSTSSDELMNVDQFVNERFKKITEPDLEIGGNALNLDLNTLDLFEFQGS